MSFGVTHPVLHLGTHPPRRVVIRIWRLLRKVVSQSWTWSCVMVSNQNSWRDFLVSCQQHRPCWRLQNCHLQDWLIDLKKPKWKKGDDLSFPSVFTIKSTIFWFPNFLFSYKDQPNGFQSPIFWQQDSRHSLRGPPKAAPPKIKTWKRRFRYWKPSFSGCKRWFTTGKSLETMMSI